MEPLSLKWSITAISRRPAGLLSTLRGQLPVARWIFRIRVSLRRVRDSRLSTWAQICRRHAPCPQGPTKIPGLVHLAGAAPVEHLQADIFICRNKGYGVWRGIEPLRVTRAEQQDREPESARDAADDLPLAHTCAS